MANVVWLTGLPSSGKTTLAKSLGFYNLDGDTLRNGLCKDLSFSIEDRSENIRRSAEVARLLSEMGVDVVCSFITPLESDRELVRSIIPDVIMVYLNCSLDTCIERDAKGLYKKALAGEIKEFTGISSPYEIPEDEISVDTEKPLEESIEDLWTIVTHFL